MDGRMVMRMETRKADDVVIAEAAAWIARLQSSERTAAAEAAFREWLTADPLHARAFSRATDVWEIIAGAARGIVRERIDHEHVDQSTLERRAGSARPGPKNSKRWLALGMTSAVASLAALA